MKILFLIIAFLGFMLLFKTKARVKKISIYNKVNEKDKLQDKKDNKTEINNQTKELSEFIALPFILENIIYFKTLIIVVNLVILVILLSTGLININITVFIVFGLITIVGTLFLPKIIIKNILYKRTESVLKSLPFFIDITAACVQSGMTIDGALNYTAKKFKLINPDLSLIMIKMSKRAEINGLELAIKELHQCSTAMEIRMFCSALQYSISFGSSIYDQLAKLSQEMREMQLLVSEEKVSKLSTKLTFPLFIFILIPFIVLVISPSVLELLTHVQKM
ncbi:type II secretion system F family protein [Yersinia rohdei]|uniref:Putative tight adherance operon protein n=1 Tax=Yersinia rohdei TaxID=29485 RepID=A0A0U1HNV4_YERRO|nr:type II secretion system F family protein [Yersinia rohdei]CQI88223.1 putative tight adherance operon protein [Yersinia rohdei]